MSELQRYAADQEAAITHGKERGQAADLLRRVAPFPVRSWAKLNLTTALTPLSARKARRFADAPGDLRLQLGSGMNNLEGWVNLDLIGEQPDLVWDLRRALPFPTGSARAVVLEHVLEHFSLVDGLALLRRCARVLGSGGTIRVGVPDFGAYLTSYAGDHEFIERLRPGRPTPLLAVGEVALRHGHRSVWDGETLTLAVRDSGFDDARVMAWGESSIDPVPDNSLRRDESVYVEGHRNGSRAAHK